MAIKPYQKVQSISDFLIKPKVYRTLRTPVIRARSSRDSHCNNSIMLIRHIALPELCKVGIMMRHSKGKQPCVKGLPYFTINKTDKHFYAPIKHKKFNNFVGLRTTDTNQWSFFCCWRQRMDYHAYFSGQKKNNQFKKWEMIKQRNKLFNSLYRIRENQVQQKGLA